MNKKFILVILAGLVLLAEFTFVYAKHINKEAKPSKIVPRGEVKPSERKSVLRERIRTGTIQERPKTLEDLKVALEKIGKTYTPPPESIEIEVHELEVDRIATPQGLLDERPLTECWIWSLQGYGYPWPWFLGSDPHLNCVGSAEIWLLQDAQLRPWDSNCGYPIYPFAVSGVWFIIITPAACTLECEFAVTWDYGTPNWGYSFPYLTEPDWSSGPVEIILPEPGNYWVHADIPQEERPCYHVPFFAMFSLLNTDDFSESPNPVRCGPDTTRYDFWITTIYDISAREHYGYYYNDLIGGYYDLNDLLGGICALSAGGYTRHQNQCQLESLWHHKSAHFDTAETGEVIAYAPDGMPDFNQYDTAFANGGAAFCGPTALADFLWWSFSGGFPWYAIHNWYEAWDPSVPLQLIQELADCMNTDPAYGTNVYDLQQCIDLLNDAYVLFLMQSVIYQPSFNDIEYQVRLSRDVILLIGFWYYDEEAEQWYRYGGHYVTASGVNWEFYLFSFSDPALNAVCDYGWFGDSSGFGYFIPHTEPFCDPLCHYDAGNVSHDYYQVLLESPSPGGNIALPQYGNEPESIWTNFFGQNFTPEFEEYRSDNPEPQYPIVAEIEYAFVVRPVSPFVDGYIASFNLVIWQTNYGKEGPGCIYNCDYPTFTLDLVDGTIILGTNPYNLAFAYKEDFRFLPYDRPGDFLDCQDTYYEHMEIDTCYAKYFHNVPDYELPLDVEMFATGFDPVGYTCPGKPCADLALQNFVITNTGDTTINNLEWALFLDWDVNESSPQSCGGDSTLNTGWAFDPSDPDKCVFLTLVPTDSGKIVPTYHCSDSNYFHSSSPDSPHTALKSVMDTPFWITPETPSENYVYLMSSQKFSLDPDSSVLQEYIIWYDNQLPSTDYAAFKHKLYQLLRLVGYYRGDVGDFSSGQGSPGIADITDIVYIVNYLFRDGPSPHPFIDQGDVNYDGECDIADVVQLANYLLKGIGAPPVDKNRVFPAEYRERFKRTSLFDDPQWQNLGQ